MDHFIGIDIAKATLQVYFPLNKEDFTVENNPRGLKTLWTKIKKYYKKEASRIVLIYEPTGSYSTLIKHFCHERQIRSFIVNPRQSANFAKARNERNKSDPVDARMLSRMHVLADPEQIAVPDINPNQEALHDLMTYYRFTTKQRVNTQNHLESAQAKGSDSFIIKRLEREIKRLKDEEQNILDRMLSIVEASSNLKHKFESITTFKGVGPVAGLALLHLFISYPDANRKEIVALTGLDVTTAQSGSSLNRKGKISKKGSRIYRGILFMATLNAILHNPEIRDFYNRLKANGKHSTAAQIAAMRKIVVITHSLYKNERIYEPEYFRQKSIERGTEEEQGRGENVA